MPRQVTAPLGTELGLLAIFHHSSLKDPKSIYTTKESMGRVKGQYTSMSNERQKYTNKDGKNDGEKKCSYSLPYAEFGENVPQATL